MQAQTTSTRLAFGQAKAAALAIGIIGIAASVAIGAVTLSGARHDGAAVRTGRAEQTAPLTVQNPRFIEANQLPQAAPVVQFHHILFLEMNVMPGGASSTVMTTVRNRFLESNLLPGDAIQSGDWLTDKTYAPHHPGLMAPTSGR